MPEALPQPASSTARKKPSNEAHPLRRPAALSPQGLHRDPQGLNEHVLSGSLLGPAFGIYVWLHMQADHRTGTAHTNAARLAGELGHHPVTVRRALAVLRDRGYIRYDSDLGSRQLYEITIEKYDQHFEGAETLEHDEPTLQEPLHVPLQERVANAREHTPNRAPKKVDVRSKTKTTTTLRVRAADAPTELKADLEPKSSRRKRLEPPASHLTREAALAAAPDILRETLELFFPKTGRDTGGLPRKERA